MIEKAKTHRRITRYEEKIREKFILSVKANFKKMGFQFVLNLGDV